MAAATGRPRVDGAAASTQITTTLSAQVVRRAELRAAWAGVPKSRIYRDLIRIGLEAPVTITLISANPGDQVGDDVVELAELGDRPAWLDRPDVAAWLAEVGWGPDAPDELVYVRAGDEAPAGFPSLSIEIAGAEADEIAAALAVRPE